MIKYAVGAFDVLRGKDLNDLDEKIQRSVEAGAKAFGLGIYSNEVLEQLGINTPLKSLEDRMAIMSQIRGIDFVFPVFSLNAEELTAAINEAYRGFRQREEREKIEKKESKEFELGYAPGTYDLFHAGHLENLMLAAKRCNRLIVGVKSDKLVEEHKRRQTTINEDERMEILRHFRFVSGVYKYYRRDPHIANYFIKSKYGRPIDAIFLGSDLRKDFAEFENEFNIIYTERDPEVMKERSTTAYRDRLIRMIDEKRYTGHVPLAKESDKQVEQTSFLNPSRLPTTDDGEEISRI